MKKVIYTLLSVGLTAAVFSLTSCGDDDPEALPQIDGYNNSNEVASENLVAHWPFDGNNAERLSGTAPSNEYGDVGTATGQIGSALDLNEGALVYPPIADINSPNALNNFTVSLWVNVENTKNAGGYYTCFFGLIPVNVTDLWGDVMAAAETGRHLPSSDTLELKGNFLTHTSTGNHNHDNLALINDGLGSFFLGAKKWSHFVMRWDASTSMFHLFADGNDVGAWTDRGDEGVLIMDTPVKAVFGSLASSDIGFTGAPEQQGWNPWATAMIDDVRIYDTVLSQAEINALLNLGKAGR